MNVRQHVVELLATPHGETRFGPPYLPALIVQAAGCGRTEAYEALWGLVSEGLVCLDPAGQTGTDNWHWRLSADGRLAAGGGTWEPRDVDGFKRRLLRQAPGIDPAAIVYLDESLRAFNARCYLSASVMLGVAAEQVFTGLARAVVVAEPGRGKKLDQALDNPRSSQNARFAELRKVIEPLRPALPAGLADQITLDGVADLLRVTRNDAGHPTGVLVDEDTARAHLQVAAPWLGKMTALREHFEQQAASSSVPGTP